jgi:DNA invertase Pin-like site-specific DNA recombinase
MDYLRAGNVLLVRRLYWLGGTERILIETLHELEDKGVDIKSLTEPVLDTTTPLGCALFGIVAVFAQLRVEVARQMTPSVRTQPCSRVAAPVSRRRLRR